MAGKPEKMIKHLRKCTNISEEDRAWAHQQSTASERRLSKENAPAPTVPTIISTISTVPGDIHSAKRVRRSEDVAAMPAPALVSVPFSQEDLESDILELYVALGWSFNGADNPIWQRFLERWVQGSQPVSARRLSGPILDRRAAAVEERIKPLVAGKLGTGQCDGWKNIAKASVVSSLVTVEGEVSVGSCRLNKRTPTDSVCSLT